MGLDALLKRLTETHETPDVSLDVSPEPAWIKAETHETHETCEKTITANDAELTRHFGWLVHFSDREPVEVYCSPDATHAEILECRPDALAAEPIPERIPRVFTEAENAEWETLWRPAPEDDDRRRCTQCRRLNPLGRCIAAQEIAATQTYEPIRDILRRCEGYMPRAEDPDTRPGRERWPELIQKWNAK